RQIESGRTGLSRYDRYRPGSRRAEQEEVVTTVRSEDHDGVILPEPAPRVAARTTRTGVDNQVRPERLVQRRRYRLVIQSQRGEHILASRAHRIRRPQADPAWLDYRQTAGYRSVGAALPGPCPRHREVTR